MGKITPEITPPAPLNSTHDVAAFDCGKPALTDWLRVQALRNEGKASRTYVVCSGNRVIGYYALAAGAVERANAPSNLARNMPDPIPVFVLGRLAVDSSFHDRRIGEGLLKDALKRCLNASREIGARAVLVHAIDSEAAGFYLPYGFQAFKDDGRTLYLPLGQVAASL
ncbi:MAG TPA: GNAT family N-acetyltransferase [Rhizomicrobium sp.]|jgi:predicted N-acetyltransferase YhbS|nr:GNAT family N-acetyltransferase [Rhizomicrobium sp.]